MSKTVEIERSFEIQVDYVECSDCGKNLEFDLRADSYGDLQISVEPHSCVDESEESESV